MVLAVPPDELARAAKLCAGEDVEATVLGAVRGDRPADAALPRRSRSATCDMHFLHDGRPPVVRQATGSSRRRAEPPPARRRQRRLHRRRCCRSSARSNVCSKEWIIRQYDHEVQGGSVIKPLVGVARRRPGRRRGRHAGARLVARAWPSAAASTRATATSTRTRWPAAAIDEAVRNVVAVGADPARIALLDNFCWGNTDRPEMLGSLVLAAEACRDVALAYGTPFISGKDSLNNEYHAGGRHIVIPPTLLDQRPGPGARRPPVRDDGPEGARQRPATWSATTQRRAGRLALSPGHGPDRRRACRRSTWTLAPRAVPRAARGDRSAAWCEPATT